MLKYKNKINNSLEENPNLTSQTTLTHISIIDDGFDSKMRDLLRLLD
jgi:hypothetical protein